MHKTLVSRYNQRLISASRAADPASPPQPSWCRDKDLFIEICDAFPGAPVRLYLSDSNDLSRVVKMELVIPGIAEGDKHTSQHDRVYCREVDLIKTFIDEIGRLRIPPYKKMKMVELLDAGPLLAALLGRQVILVHHQGAEAAEHAFIPVSLMGGMALEDLDNRHAEPPSRLQWLIGKILMFDLGAVDWRHSILRRH
jgi:hypothetical protein